MFIALQGWWRFPYSSSGHRWLPVRMSFYDPNLTSHFIHYDQTEVRTAGQEATPIFYMEVNAELNWTKVEDWTTSWVLGLIPAALGWDAVIKLYEHPHSHPHPTELPLKDEQHKITEIFKVPLQASCEILYNINEHQFEQEVSSLKKQQRSFRYEIERVHLYETIWVRTLFHKTLWFVLSEHHPHALIISTNKDFRVCF